MKFRKGITDCLQWNKREWLRKNPFVLGPFIQMSDPAVVEILSEAGFNFVIIDREHGQYSIESTRRMIECSMLSGIVPIVRVKQNNEPLIMEVLDAGALGVQIPHISTAEAAEKAVSSAKFHPCGDRGLNPYIRAAGYNTERFPSYMKWANENQFIILQVEGTEGVANIDGILAVEGVDMIFLGPYDLSQSLGMPGKVNNPAVIQKMSEVIAKARARGITVGTFTDNEETALRWIGLGVRYISISYDTKMLLDRARMIVSSIQKDLEEK